MIKVKLVQTSKNRWHILAPSGITLQEDITLCSYYEALEFIKKYCSSFNTYWDYEIIPLEGK